MASKLGKLDSKHGDLFRVYPEDLEIVTDPKDILYDKRIDLPVEDSDVLNVMAIGVKLPIIVARRGEKIVVVDGRQRTKWALAANKRLKKAGDPLIRVPVVLEAGDDRKQLGMMVSLNEIRNDDPLMMKISKLGILIDRGYDDAECATMFGVTSACISEWKKIGGCSAPVKRAIDQDKITPSAAAKLSKLAPDEQKEALDALLKTAKPGKKVTIKAAKKAAKRKTGADDDASFISIKTVKKMMDALFAKGDEASAQEFAFLNGLQWATGLCETKNCCIVLPKIEEEFEV
jgi:hypothetical protein